TDITPIPLLWVIPLSLYLFSFVIVFSPSQRMPDVLHKLSVAALPLVMAALVVTVLTDLKNPYWALIGLNLFGFFVVAMVLHGEVARDRPPARHLTEFYLWVAVGGVLGGIFNAVIAPIAFDTVVEYPLMIVLACLFLPGVLLARVMRSEPSGREEETGQSGEQGEGRRGAARFVPLLLDLVLPLALGLVIVALAWAATSIEAVDTRDTVEKLLIGLAIAVCLYFAYFSNRAVRFGLGVAAVIVAATFTIGATDAFYKERSFFGVYKVTGTQGTENAYHTLTVGETNHGAQFLGPQPPVPTTYYHQTGPIGQAFQALPEETTSRVAALGLGTGSLACYNKPGQQWEFYEIDPLIQKIASDENLFTYLSDCPGQSDVVLGDARLRLAEAPSGEYSMVVGDAFSSDAIPVHLLTREALDMYLDKLNENGVVAMHISNRHLDLEPVLGNLAQDAGLVCRNQFDEDTSQVGKFASHWVLMARNEGDLGDITYDSRWRSCATDPSMSVWTDDFSNLLSTFDWE
ncbi:MAG TPA: fused MFS/spermidine synthase, partial [Rubrobacteraceae bacterium]|nr:fused MFS/spermidine synthase [Rubrobacteraceae bacterium]